MFRFLKLFSPKLQTVKFQEYLLWPKVTRRVFLDIVLSVFMLADNIIWPSYSLCKKMKFSIKDFFIKCDQIRSFLRIWSHLLKTCFIENFTFCAVAYSEAYSVAYTEAYSAQYQTSLIELFLRKYVTAKGFTEKSISRQIFLCKIRTLVFRTWLNIYDRAFCENSF